MHATNIVSKEVFEVTVQEKDGALTVNGQEQQVAAGTIVLKDAKGNVRLCHPSAFAREYKENT